MADVTYYVGQVDRTVLRVSDGTSTPLDPRLDIANHSPDGFNWGYAGSGPAQLALALLADAVGDEIALRCYHDLKTDVIAYLETGTHWVLPQSYVVDFAARQAALARFSWGAGQVEVHDAS